MPEGEIELLTEQLRIHDVTSSVFCQDNLELLKSQPDESVDLIYCDILYGTGRNPLEITKT